VIQEIENRIKKVTELVKDCEASYEKLANLLLENPKNSSEQFGDKFKKFYNHAVKSKADKEKVDKFN
jgi:hypothetical protein